MKALRSSETSESSYSTTRCEVLKKTVIFRYQPRCINHYFNPLKAELNPICHLLALLAHHIFHVSGLSVTTPTKCTLEVINVRERKEWKTSHSV